MSSSNYRTRRTTTCRPNLTRQSSPTAQPAGDESIRESDDSTNDSADGEIDNDHNISSTQERLQQILDLMHSFDWSPRLFFLAWSGAKKGSASVELRSHFCRTSQQRKDVFLQETLSH